MRDKILSDNGNGKEYWRGVEEYADTPEFAEFVKREFPDQAESWDDSVSRRNFIKVMGASLAFAGLTGCVIQPAEKIVPYVRQDENMLPGKPLYFATSMVIGGIANGVLAKSYEGRPVKIEGSLEHPGSLGTTGIFEQASLLDLYDPDRSQEVMFRGAPSNWQNFMLAVRTAIEANRADGGAGIRFLTPTITSPTLQAQFAQIAAELPNSRWIQFEPINNDNSLQGAKLAFGTPVQAVYKFDKAERILTLDADIFSGTNPRYISDFAKSRSLPEDASQMNRLYAIETRATLMGTKADHRLAVKPSQMPEIAKAVAKAIGVVGIESEYKENAEWISAMAKDLSSHKGKSVVIAGENQPAFVHAVANAINSALGNIGETVYFIDPLSPGAEKTQIEQLKELIGDIDADKVKMLVILGGNPVYDTPADLKLNQERMNKVPLRIHLGRYLDETGEHCHWHVGEKHYLESWGDARAYDGTVSFIQPLIVPLYDGKSTNEIVRLFVREDFEKADYDLVKAHWQAAGLAAEGGGGSFEDNWRRVVHDGFIAGSAFAPRSVTLNSSFLSGQPEQPKAASGLEISILPDPGVYDGRFTNNGWMQELPNPLTKVTWENVALVSPATAARLSLNRGNDPKEISGGERGQAFINTKGSNMNADVVTLTYQGETIKSGVPVWIAPGQPDDVISIYMGYGRLRAGNVGTGLGYNAYDVRRSDAMYFGFGEMTKTGRTAEIASTQIHFNMEGRDLLRVWDAHHLEEHIEAGHQHNEYDKSMYDPETYQKIYAENYKWGMSIDLNSCVGCNACVLACQSENNIPVVGKEQVTRSREMHWMRIDTYFSGTDINNPQGAHFQPVLCQQCEQAPCEVVCPVAATVHSAEGLNDMVYNRCVGTRYCSNNCPYKVRRFNFLLYQDWDTAQYKLMRNPEVSVRSRGVMEKCTYCTQRIAGARIEAEKDGRKIADGEVVTACQAVCPTGAIVFGDLNDPLSKIAKIKQDKRNYNLLNELNTQPRTTYMAELKNQNTEMPGYKAPVFEKKSSAETKAEGEGH